MRGYISAVVMVLVVGSVGADTIRWEKGSVGEFKEGRVLFTIRVNRVIDASTMICEAGEGKRGFVGGRVFVVRKYTGKEVADGDYINLEGTWKVIGTTKVKGSDKTYWTVEPEVKK